MSEAKPLSERTFIELSTTLMLQLGKISDEQERLFKKLDRLDKRIAACSEIEQVHRVGCGANWVRAREELKAAVVEMRQTARAVDLDEVMRRADFSKRSHTRYRAKHPTYDQAFRDFKCVSRSLAESAKQERSVPLEFASFG